MLHTSHCNKKLTEINEKLAASAEGSEEREQLVLEQSKISKFLDDLLNQIIIN